MSATKKLLVPLGIIVLWYLGIAGVHLNLNQWNPTAFSRVGAATGIATMLADPHLFLEPGRGYDGQFYYLIARHPFDRQLLTQALEAPLWVYQRIGYPLLVYAFSGLGQPALVPWVMPLVNLAAIVAGAYLVGRFAIEHGASPWLSLAYGLFPGLQVAFLYNLTEPLAFFLVLLGFFAFRRDQLFVSAGWLLLAALTKEITLAVPFALAMWCLANRRRQGWVFLVSLGGYAAWILCLQQVFPSGGYVTIATFDLTRPLFGWWQRWRLLTTVQSGWDAWRDALFFGCVALSGILSVRMFVRQPSAVTFTAVAWLAVTALYAIPLLLFPKEYTRHTVGLFLFFLLAAIESHDALARRVSVVTAGLSPWLLAAILQRLG